MSNITDTKKIKMLRKIPNITPLLLLALLEILL